MEMAYTELNAKLCAFLDRLCHNKWLVFDEK